MRQDVLFVAWALIVAGVVIMAYAGHQFKQPYLAWVSSESIATRFAAGFLFVVVGVIILGLAYFTRGGT